jgi:hypothetical protein
MRIIITDASKDEELNRWMIRWEEHRDDGFIQPVSLAIPLDTMEWRAAEYNIPASDINTLIDIVICERYLPPAVIEGENGLFNAPDIATARETYLAAIAEVKMKYRISTRVKGGPLDVVRSLADHNPERLAIKGMNVILARHNRGSQKLDPAVHSVLASIQELLVVTEGK